MCAALTGRETFSILHCLSAVRGARECCEIERAQTKRDGMELILHTSIMSSRMNTCNTARS